jgi:hypothetical protein
MRLRGSLSQGWLIASSDHPTPRRGVCFVESAAAGGVGDSAAPSLACSMPRKAPPGSRSAPPTGGPVGMVRHGPAAAGRGRGGVGGAGGGAGASPAPLYDPTHPDAVLLNGEQWAGGEGRLRSGRAVVPVVVDPYLSVRK